MPRTKQITRTVQTTKATCLCLNTETAEPFNTDCVLSGTYKDMKSLLKAAKSVLEADDITVCKIVNVEIEEDLYGMSEQEFLSHATKLPPRKSSANHPTE